MQISQIPKEIHIARRSLISLAKGKYYVSFSSQRQAHESGSILFISSRLFLKMHHAPTAASAPTAIKRGALLFFFSLFKNIFYSLLTKRQKPILLFLRCYNYFSRIFKKYLVLLTKRRVCCKIIYRNRLYAKRTVKNTAKGKSSFFYRTRLRGVRHTAAEGR